MIFVIVVLLFINVLMIDLNLDDLLMLEIAKLYKIDRVKYNKMVMEWIKKYVS